MLLTEYFVLLSHHGLCEEHINPETEKKKIECGVPKNFLEKLVCLTEQLYHSYCNSNENWGN